MTRKQVALPVRTERLESKLYFANERTFLLHQVVGLFVRSLNVLLETVNGLALQLSPDPPGTAINFVPVHTLQVIPRAYSGLRSSLSPARRRYSCTALSAGAIREGLYDHEDNLTMLCVV